MSELPSAGIVTPEAVLLDFDTAGAGSRIVAEVIDLVAIFLTVLILLFTISAGSSAGIMNGTIGAVVLIVGMFLIVLGYPVGFETLWRGRTPGKAAMGLRVVTKEGAPIRFRHAAARSIIGLVEIYVFAGVLATLVIIFSKRDQRVGDLVAGTIVVRDRVAGRATQAVVFMAPYGYGQYASALDVSRLSVDQYRLIRSFLLRAAELTAPARASLATRLANPTALAMNHTPPVWMHPEPFLACVGAAYQAREGGHQVFEQPGFTPPPPPPPSPTAPRPPTYPSSGYPSPTFPAAAYPSPTYPAPAPNPPPVPGVPPQQVPPQQVPPQQVPPQQVPPQQVPPQQVPPQQVPPQQVPPQQVPPQQVPPQQVPPQQVPPDPPSRPPLTPDSPRVPTRPPTT